MILESFFFEIQNNKDLTIWRDEVFGPVLVCRSFKTEEEAIRLANDSPFGLAGMQKVMSCR